MTGGRSRTRRALCTAIVAASIVAVTGCGARLSTADRDLAIRGAAAGSAPTVDAPTAAPTGAPTTSPGRRLVQGGRSEGTAGTEGTARTEGTTRTVGGPRGERQQPQCRATAANNGGRTDTGVTADTIRVGTVADLSGPVPGLFESAIQAAQAFVTYFNASHPDGICGRKLALDPYDSRTDSGGNRTATQTACTRDFAIVGSMSAFDDGGADPVNSDSCKIVDIPAIAVTTQRQESPLTYAANSASTQEWSSAVPDHFRDRNPDAVKKAGFVYIDEPEVFLLDPTGYTPQYIEQAGATSEGTWLYTDAVPLGRVDSTQELSLYASGCSAVVRPTRRRTSASSPGPPCASSPSSRSRSVPGSRARR